MDLPNNVDSWLNPSTLQKPGLLTLLGDSETWPWLPNRDYLVLSQFLLLLALTLILFSEEAHILFFSHIPQYRDYNILNHN